MKLVRNLYILKLFYFYMPKENKQNKFKKIYKNNLLILNLYFIFLLFYFILFLFHIFFPDFIETKHNIKKLILICHIPMTSLLPYYKDKSREKEINAEELFYIVKRELKEKCTKFYIIF